MAAHIGQLIPLVILVLFLSAGAWVGHQIYLSVGKMRETASEKMNKKNVVFTKDGMRVGVRQKTNESYVDSTQKYVVKAWNLGTTKDARSAISDSKKHGKSQ